MIIPQSLSQSCFLDWDWLNYLPGGSRCQGLWLIFYYTPTHESSCRPVNMCLTSYLSLHTNTLIKCRCADIMCEWRLVTDLNVSFCLYTVLSGAQRLPGLHYSITVCFVCPIRLPRCFWIILKVSCASLVLNHVAWLS